MQCITCCSSPPCTHHTLPHLPPPLIPWIPAARPSSLQDATTCLIRRLQMDHPQKQWLAVILTSRVRRPGDPTPALQQQPVQ